MRGYLLRSAQRRLVPREQAARVGARREVGVAELEEGHVGAGPDAGAQGALEALQLERRVAVLGDEGMRESGGKCGVPRNLGHVEPDVGETLGDLADAFEQVHAN